DHRREQVQLAAGPVRIAPEQALHDLGLEDDVREALGWAVVHRASDLAAQVLLGVEHDPRHRRIGIAGRELRGAGRARCTGPALSGSPPGPARLGPGGRSWAGTRLEAAEGLC